MRMQADWADGPGRGDIERLYMCSRVLNGDAVVIFVRALCAVSQEELVPASPEEPARCISSLHTAVLFLVTFFVVSQKCKS